MPDDTFRLVVTIGVSLACIAFVVQAAVSVVQSIDCCVELVVAAHGCHHELARFQVMIWDWVDGEVRLTRLCVVDVFARGVRQVEPPGCRTRAL